MNFVWSNLDIPLPLFRYKFLALFNFPWLWTLIHLWCKALFLSGLIQFINYSVGNCCVIQVNGCWEYFAESI